MNSDEIYRLKKERKDKEFVFEQWRKFLTINVAKTDINLSEHQPIAVTAEQLRTVFNNGYKLAMLQTLRSDLVSDLAKAQINDRLITSNCFEAYSNHHDDSLLQSAIDRSQEIEICTDRDVSVWSDKNM